MQTVNVNTTILKNTLVANRTKHIEDFRIAMIGWRFEVGKQLRKNAKDIESENSILPYKDILPTPLNHEQDYNLIIKMCELSSDQDVTLTSQEFNQYVLDEWGWSASFSQTTAMYNKYK